MASSGRVKEFKMPAPSFAGRKSAVFFVVIALWLVLDRLSKMQFSGQEPGGILAGPFLGLFDIRLVHNTGAAWGMFSDSTMALGIFSIIVCIVLTVYFFVTIRDANVITALGFGLVISGGIGNAIDRFSAGYVTDFIEFSFIDFPVFNIADIGVTCGVVIVLIGFVVSWHASRSQETK